MTQVKCDALVFSGSKARVASTPEFLFRSAGGAILYLPAPDCDNHLFAELGGFSGWLPSVIERWLRSFDTKSRIAVAAT